MKKKTSLVHSKNIISRGKKKEEKIFSRRLCSGCRVCQV
jgi:MinD superfamily P-loop ATPase